MNISLNYGDLLKKTLNCGDNCYSLGLLNDTQSIK